MYDENDDFLDYFSWSSIYFFMSLCKLMNSNHGYNLKMGKGNKK